MTSPVAPPASAERVSSRNQMLTRFGGATPPMILAKDASGSAKRLLRYLRPDLHRVIAVFVLTTAGITLNVTGPRLLGRMTDIVVRGALSTGVDFDELRRVGMLAVAVYATAGLFGWAQAYLLAGLVQRTLQKLRTQIEEKVHALPLSYVDRTPRGDLLSRATNDVDNISQSMQMTLSQALSSLLTLLGISVMMLTISPIVSIFALTLLPTSFLTVRWISRLSRRRFMAQWGFTGDLNAQVEEVFTGHNLVKVFGHQAEAEARFSERNAALSNSAFKAQMFAGLMQPIMMFLGNLNYLVVAVVGGLRVASGAMTIGEVQAFIQYSRQFTQPLVQVSGMMNMLQSGLASAERIFELLDAPEESPDPAPSGSDAPTAGRVEFSHVHFSYSPNRPLIQDLSLVAEPGQMVAIVGPTGAGKTTLVNLLMRFYEIDSGTITLDGVDTSTMPRAELRSNLSMVLQDTWLFEGTIRENIAYGLVGATEAQVIEAARVAYVDRFVHSLPDGYDTTIDEDGSNLSTGEKQLITIARAFLSDPAILILDEATSSVDTRTELLIQHAMAELRSRRTSFVIAHRLSTIRDADLILMMQDGRIVEQGTHEDLVARRGPYFELYDSQFRAPATEVDGDGAARDPMDGMRRMFRGGPPMGAGMPRMG